MPEKVRVHDFIDPKKGKAIPYGVYGLTRNDGWVSVGIDHDTASSPCAPSGAGGREWGGRLSSGGVAHDHRGLGGQQQCPEPSVEVGAPAIRRSDRADREDLPLPPGNEQMEQDRTSALFVHHPELARAPPDLGCHDRESHWGDTNDHGSASSGRAGPRASTPRGERSRRKRWPN